MFLLDVMNIIGCNHFEAEIIRPIDQLPVDNLLFRNAVILEFQEKVFLSKSLFEPVDGIASLLEFLMSDQGRYFTGQAPGKSYQTFLVLSQNILIDAGFVIVTFKMCV